MSLHAGCERTWCGNQLCERGEGGVGEERRRRKYDLSRGILQSEKGRRKRRKKEFGEEITSHRKRERGEKRTGKR
jgi:hypothetical protein